MTPSPSAHHRLLSSTAEEEESLDDLLHMTGFTAAAEDEQMAQCCGAKILFKKKVGQGEEGERDEYGEGSTAVSHRTLP